ncbi:MAG: hypothetical protein IJZ29_04375 [Clostridia bacterium]|nr:hypothetical protein [Clostridia bacterium]
MDWLNFLGSVLSGIISGLFTFLGVKVTIETDNKKIKIDEMNKVIEKRPRLEIIDYKGFETEKDKMENCFEIALLHIKEFYCEGNRACFNYDEKSDKNNSYNCVEYQLKNTGMTEIVEWCATSNLPKNMSVFPYEKKNFYIENKLINYEVWSDQKYIKPGQIISIRVYYLNDQVIYSNLGNPTITLWLMDINGRLWSQSFSCPNNELGVPMLNNINNFREQTSIETAVKCFENPMLW